MSELIVSFLELTGAAVCCVLVLVVVSGLIAKLLGPFVDWVTKP